MDSEVSLFRLEMSLAGTPAFEVGGGGSIPPVPQVRKRSADISAERFLVSVISFHLPGYIAFPQ